MLVDLCSQLVLVVVFGVDWTKLVTHTDRPVHLPLNISYPDEFFAPLQLGKKVFLLEQDDDILGHLNLASVVDQVRMETPSHQLSLPIIRLFNQKIDHSDPLHSRLQHSEEKLISIDLLDRSFVILVAKPQIEDVLRHRVHDHSLIVSDLVFQVDDALVLEVSIQEISQLVNLSLELSLVFKVTSVVKLMIDTATAEVLRLRLAVMRPGHELTLTLRRYCSGIISRFRASFPNEQTLDL